MESGHGQAGCGEAQGGDAAMSEPRRLEMWRDKRVEDLSREELVEALNWTTRALNRLKANHDHERENLRAFRSARSERPDGVYGHDTSILPGTYNMPSDMVVEKLA